MQCAMKCNCCKCHQHSIHLTVNCKYLRLRIPVALSACEWWSIAIGAKFKKQAKLNRHCKWNDATVNEQVVGLTIVGKYLHVMGKYATSIACCYGICRLMRNGRSSQVCAWESTCLPKEYNVTTGDNEDDWCWVVGGGPGLFLHRRVVTSRCALCAFKQTFDNPPRAEPRVLRNENLRILGRRIGDSRVTWTKLNRRSVANRGEGGGVN